jgi:phage protein U
MYAYEQIERERSTRFGHGMDRKVQFEYLLREALKDDEVVEVARDGERLQLVLGNILGEKRLTKKFPIIDW